MEGPKKMMYDKSGPKLVQALEKRNMEGYYCSTVEEAVAKVLELIPQEHTVSWGGVMTADQLGVKQALAQAAQTVMGRDYRVKVLEESNVSALSTKANPVDDIIRRAGELDIACEIDD